MIRAEIVARRVGEEAQPVVTVDGFHPDPDRLRAHGVATEFQPAKHHYPGIRAPLPPGYFADVRPVLARVLGEVFGYGGGVSLIDASFSIVTTPPAELTVMQRLPHVDSVELGRVALVHFLSPGGGDGTAFFRHRTTGFESVEEARGATYYARLNAELARAGELPFAYIADSTPLFERTGHVEARYNRAILYRSAMLHSGAIAPDAALDPDPATGRLTVTGFFAKG